MFESGCQIYPLLYTWHNACIAVYLSLLQGKAPPSFLMLVVDIREVDYVHLQSDTRAVWKKQTADSGGEHTGRSQPLWYKEEVNP